MLSRDARKEWLTLLAVGVLLAVAAGLLGWWWAVAVIALLTMALVAFFRDPDRVVPTQRGAVVAPADGRISSIHEVAHFEPFDGPATCIRIFLSVFDVHINRSPCHGEVLSIKHTPGKHRNALNPESAEDNESNLIVLAHPIRRYPVAAVRQVAGLLARTIVCTASEQQVVQRGQRIGLIKLGSTTELYLPADLKPELTVQQGQKVAAGASVVAHVTMRQESDQDTDQNAGQNVGQNVVQGSDQDQTPHQDPGQNHDEGHEQGRVEDDTAPQNAADDASAAAKRHQPVESAETLFD